MFHMTLLYEMQLMDELPMIWGGCILGYCMYEVQSPPQKENTTLATALTILSVVFTLIHIYLQVSIIFFVRHFFNSRLHDTVEFRKSIHEILDFPLNSE